MNDFNNILENGIYYIEKLSWSIIPIDSNKKPLIDWKEFQQRRASKEDLLNWVNKFQNFNIAAVTGKISGITAIDIDPRNGGTFDAFNRVTTLISNTGGGGKHYIFQYDSAIKSCDLKNGIEFKNEGRYIILPPSIHPNGNKYEWSMGPFAGTALDSFPIFAKDWLNKSTISKSLKRFDHEILSGVTEGSRNNDACSIIGKLIIYLPEKEWNNVAWPILESWNKLNNPPLEIEALKKTYIGICRNETLRRSKSQTLYNDDSLTNDSPLNIISSAELWQKEFPPNKWIIDKLIPQNGITCIAGKPKIGKSFITLYLAICIANASKFLGNFETHSSTVLLITKEDPERLLNERLKLLSSEAPKSIYFYTDSELYLDTDKYIQNIIDIIHEKGIKVIIIDSLRRIFHGDENSSQTISEVHNRFKRLLKEGISIIFIHHHGKEGIFFNKDSGDKLRGSSDILAMLDSLLMIERKDESHLKITPSHLRQDKAVQAMLVSFPIFEFEDREFSFITYLEDELDKREKAEQDILVLLKDGQFNQISIINKLIKVKDYGVTTVKNALKILSERKKIKITPKGKEKLYSLLTE